MGRAPKDYPPPGPLGQTDPKQWRLDSSDEGRHVWYYLAEGAGQHEVAPKGEEREQSIEDKYWLGLPTGVPRQPDAQGDPLAAARRGFEFYKRIQSPSGHWACEYGGPQFLLPGILITGYITGTTLPDEWRIEMSRYLFNIQRSNGVGDGGWGLHFEGVSTVLGTALNYVALRILGVDAEHPMMVKARATLHKLGGATQIPSWGKFWLSLLSCYEWEGFNPVPPELFLMPSWLPVHPSRWWVHIRNICIPMSYLYGKRYRMPLNDLTRSLRQELYVQPYNSIHWPSCRNKCASVDLYSPHPFVADALFEVLVIYEKVAPTRLRDAALRYVYRLIEMEDENTSYQGIAPVSKPMDMICRFVAEGADSEAVKRHRRTIRDFLWMTKDGMTATGTNGSQTWDCAFITQALVESGLAAEKQNQDALLRALGFLDKMQMRENPKHYKEAFRHASKGAWPFSTREQGYTVSDCTAEALKSVLLIQDMDFAPKLVSRERMEDAIDILLSLQNPHGGVASYELVRGSALLEHLNPAEIFGRIMIEYPYPECTTAFLTALVLFNQRYPDYRPKDIARASKGAIRYIHDSQRPDGSWYGSWAICFTYATMFALESLHLAGETYENSASVRKACEFLLARQMDDGGWGESYKSCETEKYVHHVKSQVVNTAWAVIALLHAQCPDHQAMKRGCQLIMDRQLPDGTWAQEAIEGIFNKTAAISYPNYKWTWTIHALGKAKRQLPSELWTSS